MVKGGIKRLWALIFTEDNFLKSILFCLFFQEEQVKTYIYRLLHQMDAVDMTKTKYKRKSCETSFYI